MAAPGNPVLFIVTGIPSSFRSAHLRHYFSQFTESEGFVCFHFRHRPEWRGENAESFGTCCCPAAVTADRAQSFIRMYGGKPWLDVDGTQVPGRCVIHKVKDGPDTDPSAFPYKTRGELQETRNAEVAQTVTATELQRMSELNPPALMPQGNVGTPTGVFLQLIRTCRLPPRLISRLGLRFPGTGRHYGKVPYSYAGTEIAHGEEGVYTASGQEITEGGHIRAKVDADKEEETIEESHSDDDDDRCEEWERHEALHEDVTSQERSKERLFEERIELKWEKGGSGLVFYTDAQYWQEEEGDFDEQTADDWDVDTSGYYEEGAGDKDAKDYLKMRLEKRKRDGISTAGEESGLGLFERYTKGIGRKLMEQQGWKEGTGLGASGAGIPDALENEGQNPKCRRGLGYHGEKLQRFCAPKPKSHIISTVYDQPRVEDGGDTLFRRQLTSAMKYVRRGRTGGND